MPGRGGALPGHPASGRELAADRAARAPAARVHPRRHGQAADPVPSGHRRGAGERRNACPQRGAPSLVEDRTDCDPGDLAGGDHARGGPAPGRALGDLAGAPAARPSAAAAPDPDLGQPRRSFELVYRAVALPARGAPALHPTQRVVAEHGRVGPTHPGPPGPGRAASPECRRDHPVVGGHRRRLESSPDFLRLEWPTTRAPRSGTPAPPRRVRR